MITSHLPPIYQQLLTCGLARWIPALMRLLQHYEGIERALEPEEQPLDYLAERLLNIIDAPPTYREQHFIDAIATMPLFYYRAAGNQMLWIPENETFQEFERRVGTVAIWQAWTPQLSNNEVTSWLYANLLESDHVRHTA
jgi:hypothetical protein